MFGRGDAGCCPHLFYFVVFSGGMIEVAVVLHVVGVGAAVAEYRARYASFFLDVVVAADCSGEFVPAADANQVFMG